MKTIIVAVVAMFLVGVVLSIWSLAISDYHGEISTVRALLAGKKVSYDELRAFRVAQCIGTGNVIGHYFHKRLSEQRLDLTEVNKLCDKKVSTLVFGYYPRD